MHDALSLRLEVAGQARVGDTVAITLRVENMSDQPVDLYLRGRTIAFDVVVTGEGDAVVWRRLEGEVVPAILQVKRLDAHEVIELPTRWDQRTNRGRHVAAGLYSLRGELLTDMPTPLETPPIHLRIVAK